MTLRCKRLDLIERLPNRCGRIPELQFPHTRSVDDQSAIGQRDQFSMCRRVTAARVGGANFARTTDVGAH